MIAPEPSARPPDAFLARRMLTSLPWPSVVEPAAPKPVRESKKSDRPRAGRVIIGEAGRTIDSWIGRPIERVPLNDRSLARARAFARAAHPALQTVLRVDRDQGEIWLDPARGAKIAQLTRPHIALAHEALAALHDEGAVHGAIDLEHVRVDPTNGTLTLLFTADTPPTATVDLDRIALARLG
jgi:serine/threonine-protein kinase